MLYMQKSVFLVDRADEFSYPSRPRERETPHEAHDTYSQNEFFIVTSKPQVSRIVEHCFGAFIVSFNNMALLEPCF